MILNEVREGSGRLTSNLLHRRCSKPAFAACEINADLDQRRCHSRIHAKLKELGL
jgi:hypothetical protein